MSECAICIETINAADRAINKCGHAFHKKCLHTWCTEKLNCPCCRAKIVTMDIDTLPILHVRLPGKQIPDHDDFLKAWEIISQAERLFSEAVLMKAPRMDTINALLTMGNVKQYGILPGKKYAVMLGNGDMDSNGLSKYQTTPLYGMPYRVGEPTVMMTTLGVPLCVEPHVENIGAMFDNSGVTFNVVNRPDMPELMISMSDDGAWTVNAATLFGNNPIDITVGMSNVVVRVTMALDNITDDTFVNYKVTHLGGMPVSKTVDRVIKCEVARYV